MNAAAEKFEQFEWLTHGITAKSPNFEPNVRGTGEKPIDYQDRLGAIAAMNSQLSKSITSIIIFGDASKGDYEFVRNHLAKLMMDEAQKDKKREPEHVAIYHLSWLVARLVIDFAINPELEDDYTAKGRLSYMGLKSHQMSAEQYRKTWKPYENTMVIAVEMAIKSAADSIEKYRKDTMKEFRA